MSIINRESGIAKYLQGVSGRLIRSYGYLCFLLALQLADVLLFTAHIGMPVHSVLGTLVWGVLSLTALLWLLPALWTNRRVEIGLRVLLGGLLSLLFIYEYHLLTAAGVPLTNSVLHQYLTPNPAEVNRALLFSGVSLISWLKGGAIVLLYALFFPLVRGLNRLLKRIPKAVTVGGVILIYIGIALLLHRPYYALTDKGTHRYESLTLAERFVVGFSSAVSQNNKAMKQLADISSLPMGEVKVTPQRPIHNVVLIIGESLRRLDMHCYGYPLETTPHIDSLARSGSLILYDDVVSCAPNTIESLPAVLTFYQTVGQDKEWYRFPTLPMAFKQAGYYTYWASNQERRGAYIQPLTAIASTCDSTFFTNARTSEYWWGEGTTYDEALMPHLMDYAQTGKPLLQIVHLYGSHTDFKDRYPREWSLFSAQDIQEPKLKEYQKQQSAEYMNSILYNDFIINGIINRYKSTSSIVLYFSDHALVRFDDPLNPNEFSYENAPTNLMIPFMVYMSDLFKQQNPDIAAQVEQAKYKPFMTDLLTHSLCGLMGIQTLYTNPALELWTPGFNFTRQRGYTGWGTTTSFKPKHPQYRE